MAKQATMAGKGGRTGPLVFATRHPRAAGAVLPRLTNLGVNPGIMSSAISVTMAQRLVRKLCPVCKKAIPLEGKNKEMIDKIVATVPHKEKIVQAAQVWQAVGCDQCNGTGYKGRIGVFEIILMTNEIDQAIKLGGSEREIQTAARPQQIPTMEEDTVIKILRGDTSVDEAMRVIDLSNEA